MKTRKQTTIKHTKSYTLPNGSKYILETDLGMPTKYGKKPKYIRNTKAVRQKITAVKGKPLVYADKVFWY